jgi:cytochrome c-type biogenesis protein CcmE
MVKEGSVARSEESLHVEFIATDYNNDLLVRYDGILPDLFREGQGVVAEGMVADGVFQASRVLAKHDENYMSVEVKAAMDAAERDRAEAVPAGESNGS